MDKLFDDHELITGRFSCDCSDHKHVLDLSIELTPEPKQRFVHCEFRFHVYGRSPRWYRLKQILKLLRGKNGEMCDFLLRQDDIEPMICLLENALPELEVPDVYEKE